MESSRYFVRDLRLFIKTACVDISHSERQIVDNFHKRRQLVTSQQLPFVQISNKERNLVDVLYREKCKQILENEPFEDVTSNFVIDELTQLEEDEVSQPAEDTTEDGESQDLLKDFNSTNLPPDTAKATANNNLESNIDKASLSNNNSKEETNILSGNSPMKESPQPYESEFARISRELMEGYACTEDSESNSSNDSKCSSVIHSFEEAAAYFKNVVGKAVNKNPKRKIVSPACHTFEELIASLYDDDEDEERPPQASTTKEVDANSSIHEQSNILTSLNENIDSNTLNARCGLETMMQSYSLYTANEEGRTSQVEIKDEVSSIINDSTEDSSEDRELPDETINVIESHLNSATSTDDTKSVSSNGTAFSVILDNFERAVTSFDNIVTEIATDVVDKLTASPIEFFDRIPATVQGDVETPAVPSTVSTDDNDEQSNILSVSNGNIQNDDTNILNTRYSVRKRKNSSGLYKESEEDDTDKENKDSDDEWTPKKKKRKAHKKIQGNKKQKSKKMRAKKIVKAVKNKLKRKRF